MLKALLHYKAVAEKRWQKIVDILLCIVGILVMVYTTALTAKSWADGGAKTPGYCDDR